MRRRIELMLFLVVVCSEAPKSAAQQATATFIYPVNGQQNVNTSTPFQWTTASGGLGYYLYVGTSVGASNLVNSGALQTTSYHVPALPGNQTLYARIWTRTPAGWALYQDITFAAASTTAQGKATFIYPVNGQQNVNTSTPFQWTAAPGGLGYQLYVGTSAGTSNLVNSGALQTTSYHVPALPANQTLYARVWTQTSAGWTLYQDITFTATSAKATFRYPTDGQVNVSTNTPFHWTTASGGLGYYLWVGTSAGALNLVNSGVLQTTSYQVPALPANQTLYARVWTQTSAGWTLYQDITFTTGFTTTQGKATFIYPVDGQQNVNTSTPFQWTPASGALGYQLYIGTTIGISDLVNSGVLHTTSYQVPALPTNRLWARIWTQTSGGWFYEDIAFMCGPMPHFSYPVPQSPQIDPTAAFRWSSSATINGIAPVYHLTIGTSPGAKDLFDSGPIPQNSYSPPSSALPLGNILYAHVTADLGDGSNWRTDTVFTVTGTPLTPVQMIYPLPGQANVDVSNPFQWTPTDLAQAYELKLSLNNSVVRDSGQIRVPRYFAENIPLGTYAGQLGTKIANQWYWVSFQFTVVHTGASMATEITHALWATDFVRTMADQQSYPYAWTDFWNRIAGRRNPASCGFYRLELLAILSEMNIAAHLPANQQPRELDIYFDGVAETHALVEFYDTDSGSWMILDPMFDLTVQKTSGGWATAEDMQKATLNKSWSSITYKFLGSYGDSLARGYYMDYPLLYLNIGKPAPPTGNDPLPYLQIRLLPTAGYGIYLVQSSQNPVNLVVDGQTRSISTNGIQSLSPMFWATSIALPQGSTASVNVYVPNRYVF